MKFALVVPSVENEGDAVAERLRGEAIELWSQLRARAEVAAFGEREGARSVLGEVPVRALGELDPRAHDRILFLVANHAACGFMLPLVARIGGNVVLLDWELGHAVRACWPEIERPGLRGFLRAAAAGGLGAARRRLREDVLLNRPIVRLADGFVVRSAELGRRILEERNAPTPIACLGEAERAEAGMDFDRRCLDLFERLPAHAAVRKSLIQNAIAGADEARERKHDGAADDARQRDGES